MYNAEKTVRETLNSISNQSYPKFEIICVNDGSTDRSEDIILKWKEANPTLDFTLVNQENKGLGNARNRGINTAKYPWTAFLDADDTWVTKRLEQMASYMTQPPCDVFYTSFKTFGRTDTPRVRNGHTLHNFEDILIQGNPIMPSAAVVRTALLLEYPFSESKALHGAEDIDLWLRLLHDNKTFCYIDEALTNYRETGGMSTRITEHIEHVINVIEKYYKLGWIDDSIYEKAIHRKNWEAGRYYHKNGKFKEANIHYSKAGQLGIKQLTIQYFAKLKITC